MSNSSHENKKAWSPIYRPEGYFPYICIPNVNEPTLTQRFHLQKNWLYRQANTLPLLLYYLQIIEMQEATHLISLTKATVPMLSTENRLRQRTILNLIFLREELNDNNFKFTKISIAYVHTLNVAGEPHG